MMAVCVCVKCYGSVWRSSFFLLFSPSVVFQSVCELVLLYEHVYLSVHNWDLWVTVVCESRVVSLFYASDIFLKKFMSAVHVSSGMWCLSAVRMIFVSMLFPVCLLSGQLPSWSVVSIS